MGKLAVVSYCLAAIAALSAVSLFTHTVSPPSSAWVLVLAGAGFVVIGAQCQSIGRGIAYSLERSGGERRLLESQIEQQQRSIDALADGLDVAIFICDLRGLILYANRRAVEMFRFESPLGRSILAITLSYDLEQLVLDAARLQSVRDAELTFSYPDDRVGVAKAWVPDEDGRRVFVSVFEITSLRRLERIRQDFVSNVSHELRTPLTVIRAMAETLLDEEKPDQEQLSRYLPKIISEVDRLTMIANDLLLLSSAESNPVRKSRCDIADVFRTVAQHLRSKATDKGLQLEVEGPDSFMIEANPDQMSQVAINLIDNAINYTTNGEIHISFEPEEHSVVVKIRDTGIGIASEHLSRVFERFYRVDRARSRSTGGTGLGLSIVKHIIESHGGSVRVESALNRGSTFIVRLPVGDPAHVPSEI